MRKKKKKIVNFNYAKFRPLDIFLSHRRNITGGIIRAACTGRFRQAFNRSLPNHAGFLIDVYGQFFAAEMGPPGLELNSLEKYRIKSEQILTIYRWSGFDDESTRLRGCRKVATQARRKLEYDTAGAIVSSKLGRWLFRRMKDKPGKSYCSEHVCEILKFCGSADTPQDLNPLDLDQYLRWDMTFSKLGFWRI